MAVSFVYPIIDFTTVDYTKIQPGAFLIGFDSSNSNKLCKMDHNGFITVIEGAGGGGGGGPQGPAGPTGPQGVPYVEVTSKSSEVGFTFVN